MLNKVEAKMLATIEIAKLLGIDYVKANLNGSCESYPTDDYDDVEWEYFLGFEGNDESGLWTVFARVSVNRETEQVTFLDYKTPDGKRMENPIKPISFA